MKEYIITDYGAKADGGMCTEAIQHAIDDCFANGGGRVVVPDGTFVTGGVRLRSNVTLYLKSGAELCGSRNPEDYTHIRNDAVEPIDEAEREDVPWIPFYESKALTFHKKPFSRWHNGLIRIFKAQNVAVIGEEGSIINGMDCFDELGEEYYRGPHAIGVWYGDNLRLEGYTVKNSANWAHCICNSKNVSVSNVTVLAGHDGAHFTTCDNVTVDNCRFYTGDDCVAGIDNINMTVTSCVLNSACSAFRIGGTNIFINKCRIYAPCKYLFRGSLSDEEKRTGVQPTLEANHRYNMLSAFTYYADYSRDIRQQPGGIRIVDCSIENADRLLHYNFSGNEPWQDNRPLESISFENVTATGLVSHGNAYGDADVPLTLEFKNCDFAVYDTAAISSFLRVCNYKRISFENVNISGLKAAPLIKKWSDGEITLVNTKSDNEAIVDADEPFIEKPI
ncbi:MAG: hypothetical protein IJ365_07945 [Clostridia bacterium]|nr:hypothetical protein [Clostridia bacterium]